MEIASLHRSSIRKTKRLLRYSKADLSTRLEEEKTQFLHQINTPETRKSMLNFFTKMESLPPSEKSTVSPMCCHRLWKRIMLSLKRFGRKLEKETKRGNPDEPIYVQKYEVLTYLGLHHHRSSLGFCVGYGFYAPTTASFTS